MVKRKAYLPERGHVLHMNFDPSVGDEMPGKHYALVLSPAAFQRATGLAIVVACTSRNYGDMVSKPLPEGLKLPKANGYVRLHQIRSVDYAERGAQFIDEVSSEYVDDVAMAVKKFIGL